MGPQFRESSILSPPYLINLVGGVLMNQVGGEGLSAHACVRICDNEI